MTSEKAKIERTHVPGGYSGSTEYVITGSLEAVTAAVEGIKGAYHPSGYGTWFNWPPAPNGPKTLKGDPSPYLAPIEIEAGVWRAKGYHSNSCD